MREWLCINVNTVVMDSQYTETVLNMFSELGINVSHKSTPLQRLSSVDSRFLRDLKLNVATVLKSKNLSPKEAHLLALGVAANEKNEVLIKAFENSSAREGAGNDEIAEVYACMAVMNTNNVFYRFRHYMDGVEYYNNQPAGLRMNVMLSPALGKEFFELLSLVISAVNGCERCVRSHEHSVKEQGATEPRIYDAVRLASVIKSLCAVI